MALFFFIGMAATVCMENMVDKCFPGSHGHGHGHGHSHGVAHGHGDDSHGQELAEVRDAQLLDRAGTGVEGNARLFKVSMVAMLALAVHSFPEGLLTFFASATDGGFLIAIGIALHHIPGGAAIACATYKSTKSFMRALQATALAGVALPIGALIGYIMVQVSGLDALTDFASGAMFSVSAGTLVAIAISGMLPEALANTSSTFTLLWVSLGFLVMESTIIFIEATGGHHHSHD